MRIHLSEEHVKMYRFLLAFFCLKSVNHLIGIIQHRIEGTRQLQYFPTTAAFGNTNLEVFADNLSHLIL
ncbi:hypothetical protein D3C74_367120 [compost metagenome]